MFRFCDVEIRTQDSVKPVEININQFARMLREVRRSRLSVYLEDLKSCVPSNHSKTILLCVICDLNGTPRAQYPKSWRRISPEFTQYVAEKIPPNSKKRELTLPDMDLLFHRTANHVLLAFTPQKARRQHAWSLMCDVVKAIELDGDTTVIERLPEFFEEDKESMLRSRRRRRKRLIFCGVVIGIGLIVLAISSVIVLLSVMLTRNMEEERPDTNVSNNL